MSKPVVEIQVRAVLPTTAGRAVFLGNEEKTFVIYVDESVGSAITLYINQSSRERPLTHDLMGLLMKAVGARVERVVINDLKTATYFARLIIVAENELMERKIIELDARPSDCIALAIAQRAPIYITQEVWHEVDDMSEILRKMVSEKEAGESEDDGDEEEEDDD
ncbi:MAG TPA: bifunctional nuclease family protein [Chthoniobacteraceae bacterium]|nr:bifunctional nuclease family protein [Chthoniobacteraceae bacterium]